MIGARVIVESMTKPAKRYFNKGESTEKSRLEIKLLKSAQRICANIDRKSFVQASHYIRDIYEESNVNNREIVYYL